MLTSSLSFALLASASAFHSEADFSLGGQLAEATPTLCDPNVQQYSGYFHLSTSGILSAKNYFYWFFESRKAPKDAPIVLWMTGGPGCSSEVALFGENGPCSVNAAGNETMPNPHSWNSAVNLLYIDQPAGTGFSYGLGLDHNEVLYFFSLTRNRFHYLILRTIECSSSIVKSCTPTRQEGGAHMPPVRGPARLPRPPSTRAGMRRLARAPALA